MYAGTPTVNDVPYERAFNKITLRDSLSRDAAYLMLDGLGGTTYSGNDANAIAEYSEFGARLLVQIEMKAEPFYQNAVSVSRGIAAAAVPVFAELLGQAALPHVLTTRTRLAGYAGTTWERSIIRVRSAVGPGFFLVVDDVNVQRPGELSIGCTFRSLGEPSLSGSSWRVRQPAAALHLQHLALPGERPTVLSTAVRTPDLRAGGSELDVQVLREIRAGRYLAGEPVRFVNCFYGDAAADPVDRTARALSRDLFRIDGPAGATFVAIGPAPHRLGPFLSDAEMTVLCGSSLSLLGVSRLSANGKTFLETDGAVHVTVDVHAATLHLQTTALRHVRTVVWEPEQSISLPLEDADGPVSVGAARVRLAHAGELRAIIQQAHAELTPAASVQTAAANAPASAGLQVEEVRRDLAPGSVPAACIAVADLDGVGGPEVVFAGPGATITAVHIADGSILWRAPASGPPLGVWAGAGEPDVPAVLCAASNATVSAFAADGTRLWTHSSTPRYYGSSGAVYRVTAGAFGAHGEWLAVAGLHGGVEVLDSKGSLLHTTEVYAHAIDQLTTLGDRARGWIALNSKASGLWLYRPATGTLVGGYARQWGTTGHVQIPCDLDGRSVLLTATSNGAGCFVLDSDAMARPAPGSVEGAGTWFVKSGEEVRGLLAIGSDDPASQRVLCGTETGFLAVLDARGKVLSEHLLQSPISTLVRLDRGPGDAPIILAAGSGPQLTALTDDCRTVGTWANIDEGAIESVWAVAPNHILARFSGGRVALLEIRTDHHGGPRDP